MQFKINSLKELSGTMGKFEEMDGLKSPDPIQSKEINGQTFVNLDDEYVNKLTPDQLQELREC